MTLPTQAALSRRAFLAGTGGVAAVLALPTTAQAASYGRLVVDVSPLRQRGLGPYAGFVQTNLQAALARRLAGRVGGGGPSLVVRVTDVQLSAFAGSRTGSSGRFGGGGTTENDYMDGEALVMSGNRLILRHPQLAVLPASSGGAWYAPDNELRRTAALCDAYAAWLARAV